MDEELTAWCRRELGAEPEVVLFRAGYLSEVTGLRLADGRGVVLKARPPAPRLAGCVAVQGALAEAGFPCPRPLAGPAPLGRLAATAEELVSGGDLLAPGPAAAGRFAALLAELVRLAPDPAAVPTLRPSPAWAAWDHDHPGLWPPPDDLDGDLDDQPRPILARPGRGSRPRAPGRPPPAPGGRPRRLGVAEPPLARRPSAGRPRLGQRRRPARARGGRAGRRRLAGDRRPWRGRHRRADRPVPGRLRAGQGPSLDAGRAPVLLRPASGSGPSTPRSSTWPAAAPTSTVWPPRSPNARPGPGSTRKPVQDPEADKATKVSEPA